MSTPIQGRRVWPDAQGWLNATEMQLPSTYGKAVNPLIRVHSRVGRWQVTCPDGSQMSLNPEIHSVEEHEDGTITVHPSLDCNRNGIMGGWHGWLRRGVFTPV